MKVYIEACQLMWVRTINQMPYQHLRKP